MENKILVTYASRTGTTASYAEAIGKTLSENGAQVEVIAMDQAKDLSSYGVVVAGSSIRQFKWLPEAARFIETHQAELAQKRFAMFTVGIALAMPKGEQSRAAAAGWVQPVRALVNPIKDGFFPGGMDFTLLPNNLETWILHLMVVIGVFPRGDQRDLNAARAWAQELSAILTS